MAYLGQFDDLVRDSDRGRAIRNTRTIAVFDDGLVICAVSVYGAGKPAARGGRGGNSDRQRQRAEVTRSRRSQTPSATTRAHKPWPARGRARP